MLRQYDTDGDGTLSSAEIQALALSPDVDRDKDEKEKGVEEMAKSGREIRVPSDASLEHALETLNNMKIEGTSRPCIIIEPGEHRCSAILEVRVQISITGTSHINAATDVVTPAIVHGVWRLCHGSGGKIQNLECINRTWDAPVISVLDGEWEFNTCKLLCGACLLDNRETPTTSGYRNLYVPVYCHGGSTHICDCRLGGFDNKATAYQGIAVTKEAQCFVDTCTVSHCTGSAFALRDAAKLRVDKSEVKNNGIVISAGFPNEASLVVTRNTFKHNHSMFGRAPPKNIEDLMDNVDITGYSILICPDI